MAGPDLAKRSILPTGGVVLGTSVLVLLIELGRSGALWQYKDLLAPIFAWGPGLVVLGAFVWLAQSYAPPMIESQVMTAKALQQLADTVERTSNSQHDLVLAMQVNSDKLEQVRDSLRQLPCRRTDCPGGEAEDAR